MIWHLTRGPTFANDGRNQRDFMMHGMSISYLCLVASSLARVSFGDTLEAKLLDPAIVGLLDRNDVAVDVHPSCPPFNAPS